MQVPKLTWAIVAAEVEFRLLGPRLGDWLALGLGYFVVACLLGNACWVLLSWQVWLLSSLDDLSRFLRLPGFLPALHGSLLSCQLRSTFVDQHLS